MIQSRWVFQQIAMAIHKLYKPDDSLSHHQTPKQPSSKIRQTIGALPFYPQVATH